MLQNKTDSERTKAARKAKVFVDRRSKYTLAGHVFLAGHDRSAQREKVFQDNYSCGGKCAECGTQLLPGEGDYEHLRGGRKFERCDCFHQVLNDGTVCTNVRRTCSMFVKDSCHARKHGRILQWTPKNTTTSADPKNA